MWDERLKLPIPPVDTVFNATAGTATMYIVGALAAVVLAYGLKYWRDTKSPIVLLMMLGGLTTTLVEPLLDIIGAAWHPIHGQRTAFELMGRRIPWWVLASYLCYFGAIGSLNYLSFRKGVTMRGVWLWCFVPIIFDVGQEELMMHFNLYYYYGQQPLIVLWKFPWWWAATNSMGEFLGISLLAFMGESLRGWRLLLIPIVMPIMDVVGYAVVGLPPVIAINTQNVAPLVSQLAGVASFALTAMAVYGVALVIGTDSPWRSRRSNNSRRQPASARL
jgi:hypothetical protein